MWAGTLIGFLQLQSYYGGVSCVCWSPDGRYIAAGGEDDLVSIYGMAERGVVAWGEGHSSWVTQVAFDPWYASVLTPGVMLWACCLDSTTNRSLPAALAALAFTLIMFSILGGSVWALERI